LGARAPELIVRCSVPNAFENVFEQVAHDGRPIRAEHRATRLHVPIGADEHVLPRVKTAAETPRRDPGALDMVHMEDVETLETPLDGLEQRSSAAYAITPPAGRTCLGPRIAGGGGDGGYGSSAFVWLRTGSIMAMNEN